jgi:hypothetical protein
MCLPPARPPARSCHGLSSSCRDRRRQAPSRWNGWCQTQRHQPRSGPSRCRSRHARSPADREQPAPSAQAAYRRPEQAMSARRTQRRLRTISSTSSAAPSQKESQSEQSLSNAHPICVTPSNDTMLTVAFAHWLPFSNDKLGRRPVQSANDIHLATAYAKRAASRRPFHDHKRRAPQLGSGGPRMMVSPRLGENINGLVGFASGLTMSSVAPARSVCCSVRSPMCSFRPNSTRWSVTFASASGAIRRAIRTRKIANHCI